MKKLFLAVLLLASVCSFGQGATLPFPPLQGPNGASIPFAKLTFCTYPATFDTLGNCTNTVTVFQDIGLNTPYPSGITTDGLGNFPPNQVVTTALWFSPAQNYCFTATGANLLHLVNFCTPFSVSNSVGPGSNPVFGNVTLTGNLLLSSTSDICWNSDSGITRAAAKSFKFGDCAGSSDGTLTLGVLNATTGNYSGIVTASNIPAGTINTGTGTTNTISKFTNGASGVQGNSGITDDGTTVKITEAFCYKTVNDVAVVIVSASCGFTTWAAALAALPSTGGTLDGRAPDAPTAIGTFDPGTSAAVTILLGPMTYTVDHFILRSGLAVIGMGIENIQGTKIQAVGAANQAPFIMPTSGSLQSVQGVILRDFELEATVGNTAQDGLFVDVSVGNLPAGSNFESATIERITFNSFKGSARHLKGRIDTPSSAVQFNNFIQNTVIVPSGNTTVGAALRIEGTVGQNYFWNDILGETTVSGSTTAYLGVTNTGDASGPYSNWCYGCTIQGGDTGVLVNGCQGCTFRDTHTEALKSFLKVTTPTTWHNNKLLLDGGTANGNVGVNSGAGRIVDASDSSNNFGTTVELSHWAIEGTPDKMATCNNGTNVIMHDNSFDQAAPSMITTGCTPGYSTSTTTLNTQNSHYAFVNGCSGGNVGTLTSGLGVNEVLVLYFNAACTLNTGGNIFIQGYATPLAFNQGTEAVFINGDQSGSNQWLLLSTTAVTPSLGIPLHSTGIVANVSATSIGTVGTNIIAGSYDVHTSCITTTSGTGTTATPTISWTDAGGAKTLTLASIALNSVTISGYDNAVFPIHPSSGAVNFAMTGTFGTSVAACDAWLTRQN